MELAKSATDNLYKFIALSGIALIGLGIVLLSNLSRDRTDAEIAATISAEQMIFRSEQLQEFIKARSELRAAEIDLIDVYGKKENWEEAKKAIAQHLEVMENDINERNDSMLSWLVSSGDARIKTEISNSIEKKAVFQTWLSSFTICIGVILCVVGFSLWYYKLQRHLDIKVAGEAVGFSPKNISVEGESVEDE